MSNADLGYVHALARVSAKMLKATLAGDTKTMEEILPMLMIRNRRFWHITMKRNCQHWLI